MSKLESKKETISESNYSNIDDKKVEKILDCRGRGKGTQYLVKWADHDSAANEWVCTNRLKDSKDLLEGFRARRASENIKKNQVRKEREDFADDNKEEDSDKNEYQNNHGKYSVKVSTRESVDKLSDKQRKQRENELETEVIDDISSKAEVIKEDKGKSAIQDETDKASKNRLVKKKSKRTSDNMVKKRVKPSENGNNGDKNGHQLFNFDKLDNGSSYITSAHIVDIESLKTMKKDLQAAVNVKKHAFINNELYFILSWNSKTTTDFYARHYFNFTEIEAENPKVLLKYLKAFLDKGHINK